jgi:hypothetical protein
MLRAGGPHVGTADLEQLLLEGMLLRHARLLRLSWRKVRVRTLLGPGHRLLIDGFDGGSPAEELLILRILLFELMPSA